MEILYSVKKQAELMAKQHEQQQRQSQQYALRKAAARVQKNLWKGAALSVHLPPLGSDGEDFSLEGRGAFDIGRHEQLPSIVGQNPKISNAERKNASLAVENFSHPQKSRTLVLRQLRNTLAGKSRAAVAGLEAGQSEKFMVETMPFQGQVFKVQVVGMSLPPNSSRKEDVDDRPPFKSPRQGPNLSDGRSSTQLKKHVVERKPGDAWGTEPASARSRGFFIHTERAAWDNNGKRSPEFNYPNENIGVGGTVSGVAGAGGGVLLPRRSPNMFRPSKKIHSLMLRGSKMDNGLSTSTVPCATPVKLEPQKPHTTPTHQMSVEGIPHELTPSEFEELTQLERLAHRDQLESNMEVTRSYRPQGVTHRKPPDLFMGGQKVAFFERMDILGELARLKSLSLPAKAKELYIGRGFKLPSTHTLNKPPRTRKHTGSNAGAATTAKMAAHVPATDSPLPYLLRGKLNMRIPSFSPTKRSTFVAPSCARRGTPASPSKPHPSSSRGTENFYTGHKNSPSSMLSYQTGMDIKYSRR